jgi:hypothetical protein
MTSETPGQGAGPDQAAPDAPPSGPSPASPAPPAWTTPPPAAPSGSAPQQPPAQSATGWGAAPAQQTPPAGPWGAPPPAAPPSWTAGPPPAAPPPGWSTAPGQSPQGQPPAPGATPPAGWAPPPQASSGNGCLRACLIAAIVGIVVVAIGFVALFAAGASFLSGFGLTSSGTLRACPIISTADLQTVLGGDVQASELTGLADATLGRALDRRVLEGAPNCWVGTSGESASAFGRIAKSSGSDAAAVYDAARTSAQDGGYFVADLPGVGDQAFCTGWSQYPATGALVRRGSDLVYVSFIQARGMGSDVVTSDNGVSYSPTSCQDAARIAELALK